MNMLSASLVDLSAIDYQRKNNNNVDTCTTKKNRCSLVYTEFAWQCLLCVSTYIARRSSSSMPSPCPFSPAVTQPLFPSSLPMVWTDQQCSSLEGKSLMALCLLAHEHGVNTDGCETKAEVIQALLAAGKAVGGVLPSDVVPSRAAPAWGGDRSPDIRAAVEVSEHYYRVRRRQEECGTSLAGETARDLLVFWPCSGINSAG